MNVKLKAVLKKEMKMTKCRYCLSRENLTLDHKHPVSRGGSDERKNMQCLCKRCNGIKSSLSARELHRLFRWFRIIEKERKERGGKPIFNLGKDELGT